MNRATKFSTFVPVFALVGTALFIAGCSAPSDTQPDTQRTEKPIVAVPSAVPTPTAPPKSTPKPKPKPTPKPKPKMPENVKAYLIKVAHGADLMGQGIDRLAEASGKASSDPALISDNDWRMNAAQGCGLLGGASDAFGEIKLVPKEYRKFQGHLQKLGKVCEKTASSFASGIDNQSVSDLETSARGMKAITEQTKSLTVEIAEIKSHYAE